MPDPIKILLAEDNPADVYLIEEALREHNVPFQITVAEDGEAAIAMILADLGLRQIRLLTNHPRKIVGLEAYGIEVVEQEPLRLEEWNFPGAASVRTIERH